MVGVVKFFHELFNPHCPHCKEERELEYNDKHHCDSCEILKTQLAIKNQENNTLLAKILKEPEPIVTNEPVRIPTAPRVGIPWRVRQAHLEAEDRAKFAAMQKSAQPDKPKESNKPTPIKAESDVQNLEQELGITEQGPEQSIG